METSLGIKEINCDNKMKNYSFLEISLIEIIIVFSILNSNYYDNNQYNPSL